MEAIQFRLLISFLRYRDQKGHERTHPGTESKTVGTDCLGVKAKSRGAIGMRIPSSFDKLPFRGMIYYVTQLFKIKTSQTPS